MLGGLFGIQVESYRSGCCRRMGGGSQDCQVVIVVAIVRAMERARVTERLVVEPSPPSRPGVYIFLGESDSIMYVGMAHDLEKVLYRYRGLEGRQAMRDRAAAGDIHGLVFWTASRQAVVPSLESLLINRYEPPWNTQHNGNPRAVEDAVPLTPNEQAWIETCLSDLGELAGRSTRSGVEGVVGRGSTEANSQRGRDPLDAVGAERARSRRMGGVGPARSDGRRGAGVGQPPFQSRQCRTRPFRSSTRQTAIEPRVRRTCRSARAMTRCWLSPGIRRDGRRFTLSLHPHEAGYSYS